MQDDDVRYLSVQIVNLNNKVVASGRIDIAATLRSERESLLAGDEISTWFEVELLSTSRSDTAPSNASNSGVTSVARPVFARVRQLLV